jgi:hypothetical protein
MLGFGRVNALDKARIARIAERQATQKDDEEEEEVWPDPITDIGEVLDDAVVEVSRYIKATPAAIDTIVLWGAGAHIQQPRSPHQHRAAGLRHLASARLWQDLAA